MENVSAKDYILESFIAKLKKEEDTKEINLEGLIDIITSEKTDILMAAQLEELIREVEDEDH